MKWIALVIKTLFRSRRRTLLTMGAVTLAIFIVTALQTIMAAMEIESVGSTSEIRLAVIEKYGGPRTELPESYGPRLARFPHVMAETPLNFTIAAVGATSGPLYVTFAVDPEPYATVVASVARLVPSSEYDCFIRAKNGALVGGEIMDKYGWRAGDQIQVWSLLHRQYMNLVACGTLRSSSAAIRQVETQFLVNRAYYREAVSRSGRVNLYWLRIDDIQNVPGVIRAVTDYYADGPLEVTVQTESAMLSHISQFTATIRLVIQVISVAVLFTVLIVTINTVALSMRERKKEIAIMKAMGYTERNVLALVILEAVTTSLIAGCAGIALAAGLFQMKGLLLSFGVAYEFQLTTDLIAQSVAISLGLGIVSGTLPAYRAARVNVVRMLHSV